MLAFLCDKLLKQLKKYNFKYIYEIRIRENKPISINYEGKFIEIDCVLDKHEIKNVFFKACNHSIYTYEKTIKNGYITTKNGYRIGICGEFIYNNGLIETIINISSLTIRISHEILGCSKIITNKIKILNDNVIIISPPGVGKTTILRDLAREISDKYEKNVVIIDEKFELSCDNSFNLGKKTDILRGINKVEGINFAIKNLRPDYIILDELSTNQEYLGIISAISCGINLICSLHANNYEDLKRKFIYNAFQKYNVFNYYVFLEKVGEIKYIYNNLGDKID